MIVASIDIGTNTVLLLIAKVDLKSQKISTLLNEYRMPRIGQGTRRSGVISSEKIKSLYKVLDEYNQIIQNFNCEIVLLTGTNAFRMASNTNLIVKEIKNIYGYDLNVISGEKEAEYAYFGATSELKDQYLTTVIDIGGSSTEIITGKAKKIITKNSLQVGSVSMTEQFLKNSPPMRLEVEYLISEVQKWFSSIQLDEKPREVIAIAGTATTLACMILGLKEFDEEKVNNYITDIKDIKILIEKLSKMKSEELVEIFGSVLTGREDIIFAGIIILHQFMELQKINHVKVSTRGIRYGAIISYLQKNN